MKIWFQLSDFYVLLWDCFPLTSIFSLPSHAAGAIREAWETSFLPMPSNLPSDTPSLEVIARADGLQEEKGRQSQLCPQHWENQSSHPQVYIWICPLSSPWWGPNEGVNQKKVSKEDTSQLLLQRGRGSARVYMPSHSLHQEIALRIWGQVLSKRECSFASSMYHPHKLNMQEG